MDRKKKLLNFLKDLRQNNAITPDNKRDLESIVRKLSNPRISNDTVDMILNSYKCIYNLDPSKKKKPEKRKGNVDTYETQKLKAMSFGHGIIYSTCFTYNDKDQEEILLSVIRAYEN